jgi:diguanylate cyclase (GGDEF)-like protein
LPARSRSIVAITEAHPSVALEPDHLLEDEPPPEPIVAGTEVSSGLAWPIAPVGWSDPLTSTDGPRYWDRMLFTERARVQRYRRPATVVLLELMGLGRLAAQWGVDVASQAVIRTGRTLTGQIRSSDCAARLEPARFAALLPETTEIDAINFVERVRTAIEEELETSADLVRLAIGWASPVDGDLGEALDLAERRLRQEIESEA